MKRIDTYRQSVLWDIELTTAEKMLLLAFAEFMDFDTLGGAHPGREKLGRMTSLSRDSVKRLTKAVIGKGWLVETRRGGSPKGGRRMASVYRGNVSDRVHGAPSTGAMVRADRGDGAPPPSQGPADVAATAGAASPPANTTTRSNGQSPHGCQYCHGNAAPGECICQPEAATA